MRLYPPTTASLDRLAAFLRQGEVVAIPTETVYGLAANALDEAACRQIFALKGRPLIDPLIVHVRDLAHAEELAQLSPQARKLAEAFWPGPLTLLGLRRPGLIPDLVTAGLPTVALRAPAHPLARDLLDRVRIPLAAPSANRFGGVSPTLPEHVASSLGAAVPHILDGGPCECGVESTIIDVRDSGKPGLLRPGAIPADALEAVLGKPLERVSGEDQISAPGQLKRHYSPRARLQVTERLLTSSDSSTAIVHFQRPAGDVGLHLFWLTEDGSHEVAARELYRLLHRLDEQGYAEVCIETPPAGPMQETLIDRLQRAAAKDS